jgi:hypothetical protein
MRGVYLPTLRDPSVCHKRCLRLVHVAGPNGISGHFTAVIGTGAEDDGDEVPAGCMIPLCDDVGRPLPLRFCGDKEPSPGNRDSAVVVIL